MNAHTQITQIALTQIAVDHGQFIFETLLSLSPTNAHAIHETFLLCPFSFKKTSQSLSSIYQVTAIKKMP